ncbi:hypothetical protein PIGHUM_00770 [Pigmentiphaga humi]|uniref:Uncharacterized protein n=1 Tax=Pigmentiphaga humi TaxID=2478468 RepID=A0A3P4AY51_9BURK|nr:hypothetical protein [Pigmentiphaga humi]VCU68712.1 hypothetical protein PIGHUM_00770 [Pigmentiphaga humi]
MSQSLLPPRFAGLEHLVDEWALPSEKARAHKRVATDIEVSRRFHGEVLPHVEPIIQYLNTFPNDPGALPPDALRLYRLAQMFMEVSAPIDLEWDSSDIEDVFPMERMNFHPPSVPG